MFRLAAIYDERSPAAGVVAVGSPPRLDEETFALVERLRRSRVSGKAADLLARFPALDRVRPDVPASSACPA